MGLETLPCVEIGIFLGINTFLKAILDWMHAKSSVEVFIWPKYFTDRLSKH